MKYKLFIAGVMLCLFSSAQSWQWGTTVGGSSSDFNNGITTDLNGNVYSVMEVSGALTINSQTFSAFGMKDILLVKYRSDGQFCWGRRIGGALEDSPNDVVCDPSGNVYVTGYFSDVVDFTCDTIISAGYRDIFLAKFDSLGNPIWVRSMGSASTEYETGTCVRYSSNDNTIVMVGSFDSTALFVDTTLTSAGAIDIFLTKWSLGGQRVLTKRFGGVGNEGASGLAIMGSGEIYIGGSADYNVFLLKLLSSGSLVWQQNATHNGFAGCSGVVVDAAGRITMSGQYSAGNIISFGPVVLPPGTSWNCFIVQYNSFGGVNWAQEISASDYSLFCTNVTADANGNIIVGTGFHSNVYTDTTISITNESVRNGMLFKYNVAGELLWKQPFIDGADEAPGNVHAANNVIYMGGIYNGSGTYDNVTLNCSTTDALLVKLSDCVPMASTTVTGVPMVNNFYCEGTTVTLGSSFTAPGYTYQWTDLGYPLSGQNNPNFLVIADGVFAVELTDPNGCTYPSPYVGITFIPFPDTNLTTQNYGFPCLIDSVKLQCANQPQCTYQWYKNGVAISGATYGYYYATVNGAYKCRITNFYGCTDTSEVYNVSIGWVVDVHSSPDTMICLGESVQLTVTGATAYSWTPSGTLSSSTSPNPIATPTVTTAYIVTGTTSICTDRDTTVVAIAPNLTPAPTVTYPAWVLLANYWPVQWYLDGDSIPGATSDYFPPPANGWYHFTYCDSFGCTWTSNTYLILDAAIIEQRDGNGIRIFPNPVTENVNVNLQDGSEIVEVALFNQIGEQVTTQVKSNSHDGSVLSMQMLESGIYYLRVQTTETIFWEKVVKQ